MATAEGFPSRVTAARAHAPRPRAAAAAGPARAPRQVCRAGVGWDGRPAPGRKFKRAPALVLVLQAQSLRGPEGRGVPLGKGRASLCPRPQRRPGLAEPVPRAERRRRPVTKGGLRAGSAGSCAARARPARLRAGQRGAPGTGGMGRAGTGRGGTSCSAGGGL